MGIGTAMFNGVSGLNSFSAAMGTVSDNISNSATTAYKSSSIRFGDMVTNYYAINSNDMEREGAGSLILGVSTDFSPGSIMGTSQWSNAAIRGEGLFAVKDPDDPSKTFYTRDGTFHMDQNNNLVNQQGFIVQNTALANISFNPTLYTSLRIETDGQIYGVQASDGVEVAIPNAKLGLFTFTNKDGLARAGGNLYEAGPEAGTRYDNATSPKAFGEILDYSVEGSNVDIAKEMVNMIIYQADYNANSKTITTCQAMMEATINMVR